MKKSLVFIIALSVFITLASFIVYKPEVNLPCIAPPCPYSPAGKGAPFTYWVEDNSWVNSSYYEWTNEIPLRGKFGRFQPIDFIVNIFIYILVLACLYFVYSKLIRKSKKK